MCGNGLRCVAKYAFDHGLVDTLAITVETGAGLLPVQMFTNAAGRVDRVEVNMGRPRLRRAELPMTGPGDEQVLDRELPVLDRTFRINCVSMGNPHCVIFVDDVATFPVATYGPVIENHPLFPRRTNVEFVQVSDRQRGAPAHLGARRRRNTGLRHRRVGSHRRRTAHRAHRHPSAQPSGRRQPGDGLGRRRGGFHDRPGCRGFHRRLSTPVKHTPQRLQRTARYRFHGFYHRAHDETGSFELHLAGSAARIHHGRAAV